MCSDSQKYKNSAFTSFRLEAAQLLAQLKPDIETLQTGLAKKLERAVDLPSLHRVTAQKILRAN